MGRREQYSWRWLIIASAWVAAWVAAWGVAAEAPPTTPHHQSMALTLAQPKGGSDPTCSTSVFDDNSFESGAGGDEWVSYSANYGSPLCGVECLGGGPDQAFIGHGWVHFRNDSEATETAYVQQQVVFPEENRGNLRFYLHGFPATTQITLNVYVDKSLIVSLNETQLAAYTDYLPLAFDVTAFLDGGIHFVEISATMEAGDPASVYVDDICLELFGGGEGEGETCQDVCDEDTNDTDMDGVSDQCEICYGTNAALADSDDDGMTDVFEIAQGLQPQNPLDGNADLDGDGLTNVEEFHRKSRPFDVNDPYTVVYVGPGGDDFSGTGAVNNPWQTLGRAVANITATVENPGLIYLLPGTYFEFVSLTPNIAVRSTVPLGASITGVLSGADGCLLDGILFAGVGPGPKLILDNCAMRVQGCRFAPDFATATGIEVYGAQSAGSVITGCVFDGCDVAVDIYGGIPFMLRNQISGWNSAGIWIHADAKSAALNTHGLGDESDPSVGYNQFVNGAGGQAVVNENPDVLKCEQNFWGTDNIEAIDNQIDGAADFEPFLVEAQLLPAGLTCTLLNGADQSRITNGSLLLAPSSITAVTDNEDGVYGFGVLGEGTYTVTATAPGLGQAARTLTLTPGAQRSIVLVLAEAEPPQCGCNPSGKSGTPPVGDLVLTLCVPLAFLAGGWLSRRAIN